MVSVGVHELRNKLSRYLRMARDGEIVLITRRKRIVAVLEKPPLPETGHAKRQTTRVQANRW